MESFNPPLISSRSGSRGVIPFTFVFIAVVATIIGLLVVTMHQSSTKIYLLILLGSIGLAGLMVFRFSYKFLLWFLIFGDSIQLVFHIGFQDSEHFFSAKGYLIHLMTFPLILLLIKYLWELFNGTARFSFRKKGLLPLLLFCSMCFISITQAVYPVYTYFELFRLVHSVLLYLFLTESIRERKDIFIIASALSFSVALQGFIAAIQFFTKSSVGLGIFGETSQVLTQMVNASLLFRSSGTFGHANLLAMYMEMFLPVVFGLALTARQLKTRILMYGAFGLGFIGLLATVSRGGIYSTSMALGFVFLFWSKRRKHLFKGIIILLVIGGLVLGVWFQTDNPVAKRLTTTEDKSTIVRLPMAKVALNMISKNLLLGVGLNGYAVAAPGYDYTVSRIAVSFPLPVHNFYLLVLAEVGIFGFIGLMLFMITVIWKALKLRNHQNEDIAMMSIGFMFGIIAFLFHTLVDFNYISSNYSFWIVAGTIMGLYRYTTRDNHIKRTIQ